MIILPLNSKQATLPLTGGKGMNLTRLVRAGLPVPGGFLVTTEAYQAFVAANKLIAPIQEQIADLVTSDPLALDATSATIRGRFTTGIIPEHVATALRQAHANLVKASSADNQSHGEVAETSSGAVAVRSSATAEDLPDLSFAGQQDTFLQVVGEEAFLQAVVNCWSSLWTARAIGYRARNNITHDEIALAVIVQLMVSSEVSGVLFTANPLSGKRSEMVIDATLGLGEALVSGQVEPDHYVVQAADGRILKKTLGGKALAMHGQAGGGTITISENAAEQQALSDEAISKLAALGRDVQALFGSPQDVEWAWASDTLWLLQSRPVTSLYPLIEGIDPDTQPVKVMFSFGAVQGLLEPMTPLGQDNIRAIFAGAARLFGFDLTVESQAVMFSAGERLFGDLTSLLRHPIGRRAILGFMKFIEPGSANVIGALIEDPRLQASGCWFKFDTAKRVGRFLIPVVTQYLRAMHHPDHMRLKFQAEAEALVFDFSQRVKIVESLADRIALYEAAIAEVFPYLLPRFVPMIGAGMASLNILNRLSVGAGWDNALAVTRGLPNNVTTEMDLALWATAVEIQADPDSRACFEVEGGPALAQMYLAGQLPTVAQTAVATFLQQYGMRGIGEIDLGRRRWQEDPTQIMQVLGSYLQIKDPAMAPDAVFRRSQQEAEEKIAELERAVRHGLFGRLRAKIVRVAARRVRALSGLREMPKFTIIRLMGTVRESLLDSGQELVDSGVLSRADDLFFLRLGEIRQLAAGEQDDWCAMAAKSHLAIERENRRRQIPRILLSDGQAFYGGKISGEPGVDADLQGSPVSPGVVEGIVRVVLDPMGVQLQPGEILVCPGTDPAWTPLFRSAGGLVMEVGGLMTHGSVVAREYGIPAVVGVYQATTRLHSGERISIDGNSGKIVVLK
jgi:pyruvate,water dikinase